MYEMELSEMWYRDKQSMDRMLDNSVIEAEPPRASYYGRSRYMRLTNEMR